MGKEVRSMISGERNGMRQQVVAHQNHRLHRTYQVWHSRVLLRIRNINLEGRLVLTFSRAGLRRLRKTRSVLSGRICRMNADLGLDFHGFLWSITSLLWIWLESEAALVGTVIFLTPSSDPKSSSSQPVNDESPVSIALCTISEVSTGIGYYYCIYIDISLYILRRSK